MISLAAALSLCCLAVATSRDADRTALRTLEARGLPTSVLSLLDPVEPHMVEALRGLGERGEIVVPLGGGESLTLELERFTVLHPQALLRSVSVAEGGDGQVELEVPAPPLELFRGRTSTGDGSAFLAVGPRGIDGWIQHDGRRHLISSGPHPSRLGGQGLPGIAVEPAALPAGSFLITGPGCHADAIEQPAGGPWNAAPPEGAVAGVVCRTATVAIETDHEFLGLFGGDVEAASAYALLLIGASSEIFRVGTGVQFQVVFLRLWETANDPWSQTNATNQLYQFRDHWLANMGWVDRTEAHFLSGRALGGGVAWLPGTCNDLSFALSGNLGGSFPYPLQDNNWGNWDVMVVTHEAGHNFGAPHTHSMSPPVDNCGNGDCTDANQGTIMSYCHICAGGMSNIVVAFAPATNQAILAHLSSESAWCIPSGEQAVAYDDHATILMNEPVQLDVLANDLAASCTALELGAHDKVGSAGGAVGRCVGCGPDGRDLLEYTPSSGFAGIDTFTYQSVANAGVATGTVHVEVKPFLAGVPVPTPMPGLAVGYYELDDPVVLPNFALLSPYLTDVALGVNYPSTGGNFATSGRSDLVGAVFEGLLVVPANGLYTLFLESDDGSRLLLHDQVIVDNDGLHGMVEKSGTVPMLAGAHPVRIEFFERFGGAGLIARIAGPGMPKQVVPAAMWARGASADLNGDGVVDGSDLGLLLALWGSGSAEGDLNGDGVVDAADLGLLLGAWSD